MKPEVYRLLRSRGWTVGRLAEAAGVSRTHLSEVLRNRPGRGGQVRRKVAPLLEPDELDAVGWTVDGRRKTDFNHRDTEDTEGTSVPANAPAARGAGNSR